MGRTIHLNVASGRRKIDITDEAASRLLGASLLVEINGELRIDGRFDVFGHLAAMLVGVVDAQDDKRYTIGDVTMRHVFEPAGLRNMSDMQAVMDSVERALIERHITTSLAGRATDRLIELVEELCDSVDAEGQDVGGARGSLAVLREIGPALNAAVQERKKSAVPSGMVSITTNGTTRIIPADEPVFLLRGQDGAAADTVREWCNLAHKAGASEAILEEASRHADKMDAWPVKKVPDLPGQHVPIDEHLPETPLDPQDCDPVLVGATYMHKHDCPRAIKLGLPRFKAPSQEAQAELDEHKGLPVAGYKPTQSQEAIDLVNEGKELEERVLRWIDRVDYDTMGFRIGGSFDIQKGFMQIYRAVFQPDGSRISLPEDKA